jgi:glutamate synthase domain-containing protein 3
MTLLADWPQAAASFVKVMPRDYKRALRAASEAVAAAASTTGAPLAQVAHG